MNLYRFIIQLGGISYGIFRQKSREKDFNNDNVFEADFTVNDDDGKEYNKNDGIKGVDSIMDSISTSLTVNSAIEIGGKTLATGALTANAVYHGIQIAKTLKANEPLNPLNVVMAGVSTLAGIIEAKSTVDAVIKPLTLPKKLLTRSVDTIVV